VSISSKGPERHRFGVHERAVAAIGQGTWFLEQGNPGLATATLRRGLDLGMTHIDTAELYGRGTVEQLVGAAIAGRREEVFLVSKVVPEHASRGGTMRACEASLKRLKTDRLDCYLLHWRGEFPLVQTIEAFEQLRSDGKIRSWGVSNFAVRDLEELHEIAGDGRIVCNQVLYNLTERSIEHDVLTWCERHGVAVVGYAPFGHGAFPGPRTKGGRVLREIAAAYGATPRQVALHFLVRRPSLFTIPKASSPGHAEENAGALRLKLRKTDLARIDAIFPRGRRSPDLPVL